MIQLPLAVLALLPSGAGSAGPTAPGARAPQDAPAWSALPLPALCAEPASGVELLPLEAGVHVDLGRDAPSTAGASPFGFAASGYRLPVSQLSELLEDDARRHDEVLRILRPAPPLVASGPPAAIERARATCLALDGLAGQQEIRLAAWLLPGSAEAGPAVLAPGAGSPPRTAPLHSATVRSGEAVRFGERTEHAFLASWRAEVAASSEIADPVFGSVRTGRTLHLSAWRAAGGRAVRIEGLLDLSELAELVPWDSGSPDLGLIQLPTVRSVQVRFGGRIESGGRLRVVIEGAPLAIPDWTVLVQATALPDAPVGGWRAADVALLEAPVRLQELPTPGHGLAGAELFELPGVALEPLGALTLFGQLQASTSGRRGPGPEVQALPGLLLAPASETAFWAGAEALIAAAEEARLGTARLEVRAGALRVALPVGEGLTARVLAGEERTWVADYEPQIAPESWLAAPDVRRRFDGVLVQGRLGGEAFPFAWWSASTAAGEPLGPRDTTHGRLEPIERSFRGDRGRLRADRGARVLDSAAAGGAPLAVELTGL